eukprot:scaffold30826_cov67-Phaeocystis_antarctica.AAC.3
MLRPCWQLAVQVLKLRFEAIGGSAEHNKGRASRRLPIAHVEVLAAISVVVVSHIGAGTQDRFDGSGSALGYAIVVPLVGHLRNLRRLLHVGAPGWSFRLELAPAPKGAHVYTRCVWIWASQPKARTIAFSPWVGREERGWGRRPRPAGRKGQRAEHAAGQQQRRAELPRGKT